MSLAKKAGKAGALLFARKIWGALINIGVIAYLARTLDKSDFGLVAISGTLIGFIQTIGLSGLGEYVVFYSGPDREEINNAAFWLNALITVSIVLVTLLVAPLWSGLYEDPRIFNLLCLMLIGFAFSMFSSIPQAIFRKELDYQPMVFLQSIFGTLSQLSQMLFAFLDFGVYSLALPAALVTPLLSLFLFWRSGFRPKWHETGRRHWKMIFKYTKNVIGARILGKFANEGDTLLIGKLLGMEALGIYDIAFKLANLINGQLLPIITNISMPVFAKNQHDIPMVRKHYLKMIELISFLFFPFFAVLILSASLLIPLLYGPKWNAAIVPFQILCLFAVFRTLSSPTSGLYNALGKPQIGLYFTAVFTPLFLTTLYFSSGYGLVAACVTVMIVRQMGSGVLLYIGNRLLNTGFRDFFYSIKAPLISSLISAIIILLFPGQVQNTWFGLFLFALTYGMFMWLLFRKELGRGLQLVNQLNPIRIKSKE